VYKGSLPKGVKRRRASALVKRTPKKDLRGGKKTSNIRFNTGEIKKRRAGLSLG